MVFFAGGKIVRSTAFSMTGLSDVGSEPRSMSFSQVHNLTKANFIPDNTEASLQALYRRVSMKRFSPTPPQFCAFT